MHQFVLSQTPTPSFSHHKSEINEEISLASTFYGPPVEQRSCEGCISDLLSLSMFVTELTMVWAHWLLM